MSDVLSPFKNAESYTIFGLFSTAIGFFGLFDFSFYDSRQMLGLFLFYVVGNVAFALGFPLMIFKRWPTAFNVRTPKYIEYAYIFVLTFGLGQIFFIGVGNLLSS